MSGNTKIKKGLLFNSIKSNEKSDFVEFDRFNRLQFCKSTHLVQRNISNLINEELFKNEKSIDELSQQTTSRKLNCYKKKPP